MMNARPGSGSLLHRSWLVGAVASLSLTACATSGSSGGEPPSPGDTVDIGYGTVDADHQVGAVRTVQARDAAARSRTLSEMLSRIPGVQVLGGSGGSLTVRIRGTGSFMGGKEPLWVLDGVPIAAGAGLSGINPNTIESITVLKDAGDTAIYGTRGANGVILVKTRGAGG
jgi:TonB-dependent starch-binding outer membrane protein SusC